MSRNIKPECEHRKPVHRRQNKLKQQKTRNSTATIQNPDPGQPLLNYIFTELFPYQPKDWA